MAQAKPGSQAPRAEEGNVWQELLKQATRKQTQGNANLIVAGDTHCGKTKLLSRMSDRHLHPNNREYILDYSYIDVKNKASSDRDEVVARLNVWQLSDPKSMGIVPVPATALRQTVFVVVVNLADPSTIPSSLTLWLNTIKSHVESLMAKLPAEQQQELKRRISETVSFFVDVSLKSTAADTTRIAEEDKRRVEADLSKPEINLGVPIIVVGCKGDMLRPAKGYTHHADEQFEFLVKHLRKICYQYGAALIFTSAGARVGVDVFEDYVYHRLYGFELTHKAKATGTVDDFLIFVPSGFDTEQLIRDAPQGKWGEDTPFEQVFPSSSSHRSRSTRESVTVPDNNTFFKMLDEQIKSGVSIRSKPSTDKFPESSRPVARPWLDPEGSSPVTSPTAVPGKPSSSAKFAFPAPSPGSSGSGAPGFSGDVPDNAVAKRFFQGLLNSTSRLDRRQVAERLAAKKQQAAAAGQASISGSGSSSGGSS